MGQHNHSTPNTLCQDKFHKMPCGKPVDKLWKTSHLSTTFQSGTVFSTFSPQVIHRENALFHNISTGARRHIHGGAGRFAGARLACALRNPPQARILFAARERRVVSPREPRRASAGVSRRPPLSTRDIDDAARPIAPCCYLTQSGHPPWWPLPISTRGSRRPAPARIVGPRPAPPKGGAVPGPRASRREPRGSPAPARARSF